MLVPVKLWDPCVLVWVPSRLATRVLSILRLWSLLPLLVFVVLVYGLVSGLSFSVLSTVCIVIRVSCILVWVVLLLVWLLSPSSSAPLP